MEEREKDYKCSFCGYTEDDGIQDERVESQLKRRDLK